MSAAITRPPLRRLEVTSKFGPRVHPVTGEQSFHGGVDFRAAVGTFVFAVGRGVISRTQSTPAGGHQVQLELEDGTIVDYLHLDQILVFDRDVVEAGDIIATAGASGRVTGPHLHFGIKVGGVAVDPVPLLARWMGGAGGAAAVALLLLVVAVGRALA